MLIDPSKAIKVNHYKTIGGRDKLLYAIVTDSIEKAMQYADKWEKLSPDNHAVYTKCT